MERNLELLSLIVDLNVRHSISGQVDFTNIGYMLKDGYLKESLICTVEYLEGMLKTELDREDEKFFILINKSVQLGMNQADIDNMHFFRQLRNKAVHGNIVFTQLQYPGEYPIYPLNEVTCYEKVVEENYYFLLKIIEKLLKRNTVLKYEEPKCQMKTPRFFEVSLNDIGKEFGWEQEDVDKILDANDGNRRRAAELIMAGGSIRMWESVLKSIFE